MLFVVAAGILSACESSEERAEKFYQSAISLLAAGDEDRAIVEFRNVFRLNERHREARSKFAAIQRDRGNIRAAVGQYLKLVEQYPDDFEGQKAVAEIYAQTGNWRGMERHLQAAGALRPDDKTIQTLQAMSDYQQALDAGDIDAVARIVAVAQSLSTELPDNILLRQILIDNHVRQASFDLALAELNKAITTAPDDRRLYIVRLSVLSSLGDFVGIETQLKDMITLFPEDETSRQSLVRWYVSQGQLDTAEGYLRDAATGGASTIADRISLIQFLRQLRSEEAALSELNSMVAAGETDPMILSLRSGFEFDRGNSDLAISQLRDILASMQPGTETDRLNVALSQMLESTGDSVGARALIEAVLEADRSNIAALKIQAAYLINGDRAGDAILALRTALDQSPRDADILTLMARAHERDGDQDLVSDMLALAMTAADGAPRETVRYARNLFLQEKFSIAEGVLVESLRLAPGNLPILAALGTVYVRTQDWPRAQQVQATLRRLDTDQAITASNELQSLIYQGQQNLSENVAFLEGLIDQGEAGFGANLAIVRNYLDAGQAQKAKDFTARLLVSAPDDPAVRFLSASVDVVIGDITGAEQEFRALIAQDSTRTQVWVALFRLLSATDRAAQASAVIDDALLVVKDAPTLQWIKAGLLEMDGDVEGAIALYEAMYLVDSSNLIIANNLASLLATARDDADSIQRATIIARRLRSSTVPPFQDTYGWTELLRGQIDAAVRALEPAAAGLSTDPSVQYHLAKAYVAAENNAGALTQFEKVVALTGAADTRDFVVEARREINRLKAEGAASAQE